MSKPKYHHLIPQVYMKEWCYEYNKIYIVDKENKYNVLSKDIENFGGIKHFYTIKPGKCFAPHDYLKDIYNSLDRYIIIYEGKKLVSLREYNSKFYDYDNWCILDNNKHKISKKEKNIIKQAIEQNRNFDIENLWDRKYETKWKNILKVINQKINNTSDKYIDEFYKALLMKWIVSLDWRGFETNKTFQEIFNFIMVKIGIKKDDEDLKYIYEELRHELLLRYFYEFLNNDGLIYGTAKYYIHNATIVFLKAPNNIEFITSDNPSFTYTKNGLNHHIMPISPKTLICIAKDKNHKNKYLVKEINRNEVKEYNRIIKDNSFRYLIKKNINIKELL